MILTWSEKAYKGTVMNRVLPTLHGRSLKLHVQSLKRSKEKAQKESKTKEAKRKRRNKNNIKERKRKRRTKILLKKERKRKQRKKI